MYKRANTIIQDWYTNAVKTNDGMTALMRACHKGHLETVRLLLQHGADPQLLCHAGRTAHSYAEDYPLIQALLTP
jgi:ankyrin repeat protein